jgi:hypothetical protein
MPISSRPRERGIVALRPTPKKIATPAPAAQAPRETNAITSRLVLLYAEQAGGPEAVDQVLARRYHELPTGAAHQSPP